MKNLIIFSIIFLLLNLNNVLCAREQERTFNKEPFEAGARSILLPGWGQIYNNQPVKGFIIFGIEIGAISTSLVFNKLGGDYRSKYETATNPEDAIKYYDKSNDYYRMRNYLLWGYIGVWAFNVIDAIINADGDVNGHSIKETRRNLEKIVVFQIEEDDTNRETVFMIKKTFSW